MKFQIREPLTYLAAVVAALTMFTQSDDGPAWARQAHAAGAGKESSQRILFAGEIENGQRIDHDDPYLPPISDREARDGRAENFDRCGVAVDVYRQTGQVARIGFDDPKHLFTVHVSTERWMHEGPDEAMLEDLACYFAAGDARRQIIFPIHDDQGRRLGMWRKVRFVPAALQAKKSRRIL